jgi:NADH-quinone oxidoreductase subunit E
MTNVADPFRAVLESFPSEPRQLLPILQAVQARFRYLPEEALRELARYLSLPLARVYAVAGFYRALSLKPKGEKLVKVCLGTACHLRGAPRIVAALEESLGIPLGETGPDGRVSLESVNCLGACALAPVVTVDETVYGKLSPGSAKKLPI